MHMIYNAKSQKVSHKIVEFFIIDLIRKNGILTQWENYPHYSQ